MKGSHIAIDAFCHGSGVSAVRSVSGHSCVDEVDVQQGVTRKDELLGEACVQPLSGDAVAVEDNRGVVCQSELLRRSEHGGENNRRSKAATKEVQFHCIIPVMDVHDTEFRNASGCGTP